MIQSKKAFIYNEATQEKGIIVRRVDKKQFIENGLLVLVNDYHKKIEIIEEKEIETLVIMPEKYKESIYTTDEINGLFQILNEPILATDLFMEKFDAMIDKVLFQSTIQEQRYGSSSKDWEIIKS
jgi:hypothetical protein